MALMREIDKAYIKWPFLGVRQMRRYLVNLGYPVGNKRVRRLMRVMGIMAIYPKPRTSILDPENRSYPYLLRGINGMPMFIFIEKKGREEPFVPIMTLRLRSGNVLDSGPYDRKFVNLILCNSMEACFPGLTGSMQGKGGRPPYPFNKFISMCG